MLEVFFGTMSAGKSTKLLQDRYNYMQKNKDVWVIKPNIDRTNEPKIINKFGLECPAEILKEIKWKDIILRKEFYSNIILIDEVQFFKPKDIDNLVVLSDRYSRNIRCYGLMTDVNEKLFPTAKHLIEVGAKINWMEAPCQMIGCDNNATHHLRYHRMGYIIRDGKSVEVDDGKDIFYRSVCRQCYDREMQKSR